MAKLSFEAQAVMTAFFENVDRPEFFSQRVAAVLRVVANQIWMEKPLGITDADAGVFAAHQVISTSVVAIAEELEALPTSYTTNPQ